MDMQLLVAVIIGALALIYIVFRFKKQLYQVEKDPKCDQCPVPEIDQDNNNKRYYIFRYWYNKNISSNWRFREFIYKISKFFDASS